MHHRMMKQNQKVPRYARNTTTLGNMHLAHVATINTYVQSVIVSIWQRPVKEKTIRNKGKQMKANPKLNKKEKY